MRILFLTHAFNSLTQRLFVELREVGHEVSVEFDINDEVAMQAVELYRPDLIIAPFSETCHTGRYLARTCLSGGASGHPG